MDLKRIASRIADTSKGRGSFLDGMTQSQLDEACRKAYDAWMDISDREYPDPAELQKADDEALELTKSIVHLMDAGAKAPPGMNPETLPIIRDMAGMGTDDDATANEENLKELEKFLDRGGALPEKLGGGGGIQAFCGRVARRIALS